MLSLRRMTMTLRFSAPVHIALGLVCTLTVCYVVYSLSWNDTAVDQDPTETELESLWANSKAKTVHLKTEPKDQDAKQESQKSQQDASRQTLSVCPQETRLRALAKACNKRSLKVGQIEDVMIPELLGDMLVSDKKQLLYCGVPKVGYIFWTYVLARTAQGQDPTDGPRVLDKASLEAAGLRRLRSYSIPEARERLEKYFSFIAVRHPFHRLVSVWKDRFSTSSDLGPLLNKLGSSVAQKYADERKEDYQFQNISKFAEFVDDLALTNMTDTHWNSVQSLCHPCALKWDAILKLETAHHDTAPVLERLGMRLLDAQGSQPKLGAVVDKRPLDEFKGLLPRVLLYLYKIYGQDMSMFDYGWTQEGYVATCGEKERCC